MPYRRMRFGEYVTQSIVLLIGGMILSFLCSLLGVGIFGLGLAAGILGLRHTPARRAEAYIGIIGNALGLVILIVLLVASAVYRSRA